MESDKDKIRKVFDIFDKDHSGFIEINEIAAVAKELGHEMKPEKIKKIFSDIDTNKDKKISFEEFHAWWQFGRDNDMETLVALQLKAFNLLNKAKTHFHKINSQIVGSSSSDVGAHSVRLAVGSPENTKSSINIKMFIGSSQVEFASQILKGLNIGTDVPAVIFRFQTTNPEAAKTSLESLVGGLKEMAAAMIPEDLGFGDIIELIDFGYGIDGDDVILSVSSSNPMLTFLIENYLEVVSLYLGNEFRTEFETDIGFNFDFNTVFDNKDKKIVDIFGKGFHLNLGLKVSQHLKDNYKNIVFNKAETLNQTSDTLAARYISKFAFLVLLKSFNLEVILKDFEDLTLKTSGTPLEGMLKQASMSPAEALEGLKKEVPIQAMASEMPIIGEVLAFFKLLNEKISITLQIPRVSVNICLSTKGASRLLDFLTDQEN